VVTVQPSSEEPELSVPRFWNRNLKGHSASSIRSRWGFEPLFFDVIATQDSPGVSRTRGPSRYDEGHHSLRRRSLLPRLLRELCAQGYAGSYSILNHVRPLRLSRAVKATMRFETKPGEQAQVDFGHFPFLAPDDPKLFWRSLACRE